MIEILNILFLSNNQKKDGGISNGKQKKFNNVPQ